MKKNIKIFITIFTILLLSTGCVKYETTMTINDDNSFKYATIIGYNKSQTAKVNGEEVNLQDQTTVDEDTKKEFKKYGINVEQYEDDDTIGLSLYKLFDSIDDVTTEVDTSCELDLYNKVVDNQYCFKKTKGFFFDTYKAKISTKMYYEGLNSAGMSNQQNIHSIEDYKREYNITDDKFDTQLNDDGTAVFTSKEPPWKIYMYDQQTIDEYNEELEDMYGQLDESASIKFILNNYTKVGKNNATKEENGGKKLIWDFKDQENKIDYIEFEINKPNWLFIIIGAVAGFVIIILVIGIIGGTINNMAQKKQEEAANKNNNLATINPEQVEDIQENPMINKLLAPDTNTESTPTPMPEEPVMPVEEDEPIKTNFYE